jgi:hypothetical protein
MPEPPFSSLLLCPGPSTVRKQEPDEKIAYIAQAAIWEYFRQDFFSRYDQPRMVVGELDYKSQLTGRRGIDSVLSRMADNFKNELSRKALRKKVSTTRQGGFLKPDVLGIAVTNDAIVLELVEVTTYGQAAETLREDVEHKLNTLRTKVATEDTSVLEAEFYARTPARRTPFSISASKWRPRVDQLILPLYIDSSGGSSTAFEWICYCPTFRFFPPNGVDGLILYEVHSTTLPEHVPQEVLNRIKEEARRKQARDRLAGALTLTPWFDQAYWQNKPADRDLMLALAATAGVATLVLLAVVLAPVVAAAGTATAAGATAGGLTGAGALAEAGALTPAVLAAAAAANARAMTAATQIMHSLGQRLVPAW